MRAAGVLMLLLIAGVSALARRRPPAVVETAVEAALPATPEPAGTRPGRSRRGRARRLASAAVVVVLVAVWAITLRPAGLGGPASYVFVSGTSMEPGLSTGDLVIMRRQESYRHGDVIAYRVPGTNALVIHRIVGGSAATGYDTKGDNRESTDLWTPRPDEIRGRQLFSIPRAGSVVALLGQPLPLAFLAAALAFTTAGGPLLRSSP